MSESTSAQPSPARGEGGEASAAELVQAFDFYQGRGGLFRYTLFDPETGVTKQEAVNKINIVDGAIDFLQRAWAGFSPGALAMQTASLGNVKRFKRFLAAAGVKLRVRHPGDASLWEGVATSLNQPAGAPPAPAEPR